MLPDYGEFEQAIGLDWYALDPNLSFLLDRYLPDPADRAFAEERVAPYGRLVGETIARRAEITDANGPVLQRYDRDGYEVDEVVHHPTWLENKADLVRHGFVGLSHHAGRPVPAVVTASLSYLVSQAETAIYCGLGMTSSAVDVVERYAPEDVRGESAGSDPGRKVWPEVVEVMQEVGIDLSRNKPKRLSVEMQLHADWAVTMGCGDVCPYVPTTVDDWDIPDPAGRSLEEVREIRELIDGRVRDLAFTKIDAIRLDATAHRFRLTKLLPELIEEFGERRSAEVIRGCADRILDDYDDVPIRSHILTLAHKRTRECLRQEHCDVLELAVH